ncbi:hypothetical protein FQN54_002802 [Arachnomyces sp. PD_36]|nr:hypothetical protein FQN54_002802 [Arachnomyces sp. PD_36]
MDFPPTCLICGLGIYPGVASWHAVFQSLEVKKEQDEKSGEYFTPEKGPLVPSSFQRSSLPENDRYVHSCCWTIVVNILGTVEFEQTWLDSFYKCLEAFDPLTGLINDNAPTCDEEDVYGPPPDFVFPEFYFEDRKIEQDPNYRRGSSVFYPKRGKGIFDRFQLPDEIVQRIFFFLPDYCDVINLQFASNQAASSAIWLSMGRKFVAAHPDPKNTPLPQLTFAVKNALKNVAFLMDEYPGASNYADVWDSVEDLLHMLRSPPEGDDVGLREPLSSEPAHSLEIFTDTKEITVPRVFSLISLWFRRVTNVTKYLCGLSFDKVHLGYRGDYRLEFKMSSIRGLHLAVRDGHIISARLKSDEETTEWVPSLPRPPRWIHFLQIEPLEEITKIRANFEVLYATDEDEEMYYHPFSGPRIVPSNLLPPVYLADRNPADFNTVNCIFMSDLSPVIAISAYVMAEDQSILALELAYVNRTVTMGRSATELDPGSTRLSFHLDLDKNEVLTAVGCADATTNSGIAVQFFTNLGRTVVFGDESSRLWNYGMMTSGFFCAATVPKGPEKDYNPIRRLGVFSGSEESLNDLNIYIRPSAWAVTDASCMHQQSNVFVFAASVRRVTRIIVYHQPMFGYLTGMQLMYENGPPIILGSMDEECMSLAIREPISRVSLNITTANCTYLYHITGITFTTGSHTTGAGDWEEDAKELQMKQRVHDVPSNEIDPPLYWAFSHGGLSCLSFSPDDDFVSDHPRLS